MKKTQIIYITVLILSFSLMLFGIVKLISDYKDVQYFVDITYTSQTSNTITMKGGKGTGSTALGYTLVALSIDNEGAKDISLIPAEFSLSQQNRQLTIPTSVYTTTYTKKVLKNTKRIILLRFPLSTRIIGTIYFQGISTLKETQLSIN